MRKSIFDIASENIDMESETDRLITMSKYEYVIMDGKHNRYSLFDFVKYCCFNNWKKRGHFINLDDFLKSLRLTSIEQEAPSNINCLLTLIELIYNFWELSNKKINLYQNLNCCGNYYHLKNVMDDILAQYNHTAHINDEEEIVLVIEDKGEVTAVAEIMSTPSLAFDVIKYNHHSLKGKVELKKSILLHLGAELEPKRDQLKILNKDLKDDIFYMLNNLNIRHNNQSNGDKNYKEYVAKMKKEELEEWYDELYQQILLAFLLLDNVERTKKIKELKKSINSKVNL